MKGVNKVTIIGRLGADPDFKTVGSSANARLNVATSESWVKDGEKHERTEWHRIVVWGKLAEICSKYLKKGSAIYLEGKLQTRSWEDPKSGEKKYTTEIVASTVQFLSTSSGRGSSQDADDSYGFQDFGPEKDSKSSSKKSSKTAPPTDEPSFGEDEDLFRLENDDELKDF